MSETQTSRNRRLLWGVVAVGVAIALVAAGWFVATSRADRREPVATSRSRLIPVGVPTIVTVSDLRQLASERGPLYWAGQRPGTDVEVTVTTKGGVFVRYLPHGAKPGASKEFLTVATYDAIEGYQGLASADPKLANLVKAKSGAMIVNFKKQPLSTYFSFPRAAFQVEVYSPDPGQSLELTRDGKIELVGAGDAR